MKKLLSILLAVTVALCAVSLTACNRGGDLAVDDGEGGSLEGVTFNTRSGEMYKDTKENKTRLKISYSTGYKHAWIRQMARSFLLDDIGADYYIVLDGDSELTTGVSSKLESGTNLSDIYMPLASNWYSYAALGYLENLDSLYARQVPGEDVTVGEKMTGAWKNYGKSVRENETHYYIFPWNENITGIVYNKTMFDRYQWKVPATTDELAALCAQIVADTDGKVAPFVYPGTISGGYWDFVGTNWWLQVSGVDKLNEFMAFESAEVFNPDKKSSPSYGKLEMLETFEDIVVENRKTYTLKGSASKNNLMAQVSFAQGEAAMIPNGNWIEKESGDKIKDEIRMMRVPYMSNAIQGEGGEVVNVNYSGQPDFMMIPAKADNKEGAKDFLAFLCRDDMLLKYTSMTGAPRPFAYDVTKCELTDFARSCIDIWSTSTTWFENSSSKLWTSNKVKKFQTTNPYTTLLSQAGTVTAAGWAASEYKLVSDAWQSFVDSVS